VDLWLGAVPVGRFWTVIDAPEGIFETAPRGSTLVRDPDDRPAPGDPL